MDPSHFIQPVRKNHFEIGTIIHENKILQLGRDLEDAEVEGLVIHALMVPNGAIVMEPRDASNLFPFVSIVFVFRSKVTLLVSRPLLLVVSVLI